MSMTSPLARAKEAAKLAVTSSRVKDMCAFLVQDSRKAWISFGPTPVAFLAHEGWRGLAARDVDFIQKILIPRENRCPCGILISSSHETL
ncbi:hypothetical protein ACLB2K_050897 [Fragaria x ananassa]